MSKTTRIQDELGLRYPIIQGPFGGGLSTVELAAGVSNRGGLGSYGAHVFEADGIDQLTQRLRAQTDGPFNINLWVSDHDPGGRDVSAEAFETSWKLFEPFFDEYGLDRPDPPTNYHPRFEQQVEAVLESAPPVFSWVFGIPSAKILKACRVRGIRTLGAATTLAEARALDEAGVDYILATGADAGGHRPAFLEPAEDNLIGTLPLVRMISREIRRPVIAAGGIADRAGVEAVECLGAEAAQLGTAFLATELSGTHHAHRDVLFSDRAEKTRLTRAYTGRLARGIDNRVIAEMEKRAGQLPPFPVLAWFLGFLKRAALAAGQEDFASLYSGQGAPILEHRTLDALMDELTTPLN